MGTEGMTREELLVEIDELHRKYKNLQISYKTEIDELKNSRKELLDSEEKWKVIFKNAPDAIYLYDLKGKFLDGNLAAEKLLGYAKEELIGKSFLKINILPAKYITLAARHLSLNILGKSTGPDEFILNHKDGSEINVELSTIPVKLKKSTVVLGIARNISFRKTAEKEQKLFRAIIDGTNDAIEVIDPETGRFLDVNAKGCSDLGYSRDELLKMTVPDIDPYVSFDTFKQVVFNLEKEDNITWEGIHLRKDQSTFPVEVNLRIVNLGKKYLVSVVRDISNRKEAEEVLRRSEEKFRTIFNESPIGIELYNKNGTQTDANKASLEMFGITEVKDIFDFNIFDGISLNESQKSKLRNGESISYQSLFDFDKVKELKLYDTLRNGKAYFDYIITCLNDSTNKTPIGYLLQVQDITKRKFAEEELLKLQRAVEQSPTSILITNLDGNIEYANPKVVESSGYSLNEILGKNPRMFNSGQKTAEEYKNMWNSITSGIEWRGEFLNKRKNGELYWELASISPIFNDRGEIVHYLAIKEDITESKFKSNELRLAKEKAEESDRLKSAFLCNMSHEVRTPLNSIIGFSELLINSDFDETQKIDFANQIINSSSNLLAIITDIMDISKLESGELKIYKNEILVNTFVESIINEYELKAKNKNLNFIYSNIYVDFDVTINVDVNRLKQIFNNLISNALKFTRFGSITIGYTINENTIVFFVKDTGIGIPVEFHNDIFKRFRQVENFETRKFGGNGLGLAITKSLIDLMDGQIWLESEPGLGTTFFFAFPCRILEKSY